MEAPRRKEVRVLKKKGCPFGILCWFGAQGCCDGEHSEEDYVHFGRRATLREEEADLRCTEAAVPCVFCAQGCCRYGAACWKGVVVDSEYESAEEYPMGDEATGQETRDSRKCCNTASRRRQEEGRAAARGAGIAAGV